MGHSGHRFESNVCKKGITNGMNYNETAEYCETVIELTWSIIVVLDLDGKVSHVDSIFEDLTGHPFTEIKGTYCGVDSAVAAENCLWHHLSAHHKKRWDQDENLPKELFWFQNNTGTYPPVQHHSAKK